MIHTSNTNRLVLTLDITESDLLEIDVSKFKTIEIQILNKGDNALKELTLYSKVHLDAEYVELDVANFTETTDVLLDYYISNPGSVTTLAPNESVYLIFNCEGKKYYKLTGATIGNSYPIYLWYYAE